MLNMFSAVLRTEPMLHFVLPLSALARGSLKKEQNAAFTRSERPAFMVVWVWDPNQMAEPPLFGDQCTLSISPCIFDLISGAWRCLGLGCICHSCRMPGGAYRPFCPQREGSSSDRNIISYLHPSQPEDGVHSAQPFQGSGTDAGGGMDGLSCPPSTGAFSTCQLWAATVTAQTSTVCVARRLKERDPAQGDDLR